MQEAASTLVRKRTGTYGYSSYENTEHKDVLTIHTTLSTTASKTKQKKAYSGWKTGTREDL